MLGKHKLLGLSAVFGLLLLGFVVTFPHPAAAATGINPELSFEGKIVTSASGTNITDGTYNMQFQIYTGCTNNTGSGCTSVWTENYFDTGTNVGGVPFVSGTFQVNLGSITAFGTSVPWNTYPLYLSMDIGNNTVCSSWPTQTSCGGDGIMSPYILLTSSPYALNAGELGGLVAPTTTATASQCLQTSSSVPYTQLVLGSCGGTTPTLQATYNASTGGSPLIKLSTSIGTGTFTIQDASTSIGANLFQINNSSSGTLFSVGNTGNVTVATSTASSTALQVENNNNTTIFNVNTSTPGAQITGVLTDSAQTTSDIALVQNTGGSSGGFTVNNSQGVPIITAGNNNLLINGDFESGAGTTGWAGATAGGTIALNTDPRYVYSGADSLAVTTTTTAHTGAQVTSFNNGMAAGTYTLSFDAAVASGSFATLEASFNALGTNDCLSSATVTTSFTSFSCTYTTSGTTTAVSIGSSGTTAQTFYIDAVTVTSSGTNLLVNPGFESGITGWTAYGTGSGSIAWNQNRQNVYLGIGSVKISITGANYGIQDSTYIANQPVTGGTYTLSFYAMATTAINVSASLGPSSTCTLNSSTASTNGFSEYYCPNVSVTASPIVEIFSTSASGTLYVDAVQLISGSTLSPYNIGQIQLRGVISNPVTLQSTTNSTTALQVANVSGASLLSVDTANSNVTIDNSGLAGTIQIGNTTGAVNQNVNVGNNTTASSTDAVTIGNLNGGSATTIQSGTSGAISIQDAGGGINIGTGATADTIQLGTTLGTVTQNIYVGYNGSTDTDNVRIGNTYSGSQVVIQGGTGANAIQINPGVGGEVQIATNGVGGTQTLQFGLGVGSAVAATQNINIGNNNTSGSTDAVMIGNLLSTSLTTIQGGTTGTGTGAISIQTGAGGLLLLQTVNNGPIQTGTGGFTQGSSETFSGTTARSITGPTSGGLTINDTGGALALSTTTSGTLSVVSAGVLTLTGAAASTWSTTAGAITIQSGTGNIILQPATSATTANVQIGAGNGGSGSTTPDILALDVLSSGSSAPTEVNGGMYYSAGTNVFNCGVAGTWETCAGQLYSNTAVGSAVGTCSTACGAIASAPIPANYCTAGKTIRIFASGTYADTTTAPTLSFGFYYGTNAAKASDTLIGAASPASSETAVSTTQPWFITYNIICFSATSMSGSGTITIETSTTTTTTNLMNQFVATTTTGLTTTSAANLYLFPALGTNSAADTVTDSQFIVTGSN